jgi:hypothetical protein
MLGLRAFGSMLLSSLLTAAVCVAAGPEARLWRSEGRVALETSHPALFAGALERLLDSGFELLVVYRLELLRADGQSLAAATVSVQAVHDLWNESYAIVWHHEAGSRRRIVEGRRDALQELRRVRAELDAAPLRGQSFRLEVSARLRPATAEQTERTRQWLARPDRSGPAEDAAGPNLFSAFAHLLITPGLDEESNARFVLGPWRLDELPAGP